MTNKRLRTVSTLPEQTSVLTFREAPVGKGHEQENLLCGGCSVVLLEGVSEQTARRTFAASGRMVIECPSCGAHNVLPSQWVPENAAFG